jgi:hypothetical protein
VKGRKYRYYIHPAHPSLHRRLYDKYFPPEGEYRADTMSNVKKGPTAQGSRPRKDVLASLKMAQLEVSKPVLPAGTAFSPAFATENHSLTMTRDHVVHSRLPGPPRSHPGLANFETHA